MDLEWLKALSFPTREGITRAIENTSSCSYMSGNAHAVAIADICSMLHPTSRLLYLECLASYRNHDNPNVRRIVEYAEEFVQEELGSWASPGREDEIDRHRVLAGLRNHFDELMKRLMAYYRPGPPNPLEDDSDILSIDGFYWQVRWFLGRLLDAFPKIEEEYGANSSLAALYDTVEFILKDLEDPERMDHYTDEEPEAFLSKLESFLASL